MIRGMDTSASALIALGREQETLARSATNVSTPGFLALWPEREAAPQQALRGVSVQGNATLVSLAAAGALATGVRLVGTALDLAPCPLVPAPAGLDLAVAPLEGAFLAVRQPDGTTAYTRDGGFLRAPNGTLIAPDGAQLLGVNGQPLVVPQGPLQVRSDGSLWGADGRAVGQLLLMLPQDGQRLVPVGNARFLDPAVTMRQVAGGRVAPGFLMGSNVSLDGLLIQELEAQQRYNANVALLQLQDQGMQQLLGEIRLA
ncbi:MAG: hypothetical protein IMW91_00215 [Firmicutes bacterium]|nr:hypothetical protein [Bacillota bacterium]